MIAFDPRNKQFCTIQPHELKTGCLYLIFLSRPENQGRNSKWALKIPKLSCASYSKTVQQKGRNPISHQT